MVRPTPISRSRDPVDEAEPIESEKKDALFIYSPSLIFRG